MHGIHGRNVATARINAGLSIDQLVAKTGLTRQTVTTVERSISWPAKIDTLVRLAHVLNVTIESLIFIDEGAKHGKRRRRAAA